MTNHKNLLVALALAILYILAATLFPSVSAISLPIPDESSIYKHNPWEDSYKFTTYHPGQNYKGLSNVKNYFHKLGYIPNVPPSNFDDNFDDNLVSAIQTYQTMYNLNPTGKLDHNTLRKLMTPRCGVPDTIKTNTKTSLGSDDNNAHSIHTVSHYDYPGSRWPIGTTLLKYYFSRKNQWNQTFKSVFVNGMNRWTPEVNIKFNETSIDYIANINISFESGAHGDGYPFTDEWAHAAFPTTGWFHLNTNATWVASGDVTKRTESRAVDLESIVVHETGHLLGLDHSTNESAILYAYISPSTRKVKLTQDDKDGIRSLYNIKP